MIHHYQTSCSSTAANFLSPYGPSGNNYGRPIDNEPTHNSATYGGGFANAGAPSQSLDYPQAPPPPYSNYHAGTPLQSLGYPCAAAPPPPYSNYHAAAPSQSSGYSYTAPASTPHRGCHAGSSDREGERQSTPPTETSGYTSTTPGQSGPRHASSQDKVWFGSSHRHSGRR